MQLKEIKTIFQHELKELYPKEEIDSFFNTLINHYLKLERFVLVLEPELTITKTEEQPLFEALSRLKKEEPIQYIIGETHFLDLCLKVNRHVLIPRPETEELVNWVLDTERSRSDVSIQLNDLTTKIIDIGTGSGCIAIALAKALPKAKVIAIDISEDALTVARENAQKNEVKVEFTQADALNLELEPEFDVIVSNPPYVRELEQKEMKNNVKKYEPKRALFVPDGDPLKFYRAITLFARKSLKPNGLLFFEINQYLPQETKDILLTNGFNDVELRTDIFGNFRMLKGRKNI